MGGRMSPCQKSPARFVQLFSIDLRLVLDRQTDRQTQTDTGRHRAVASTRSSIASRGKKTAPRYKLLQFHKCLSSLCEILHSQTTMKQINKKRYIVLKKYVIKSNLLAIKPIRWKYEVDRSYSTSNSTDDGHLSILFRKVHDKLFCFMSISSRKSFKF